MTTGGSFVALASQGQAQAVWPPPPREPLPTFPGITATQPTDFYASCWAQQPYFSALPANIPRTPDLIFHRGNFCGVRVPGLVEGDNAKDPSFDITWNWTAYSDPQMRLCADFHAGVCGYTHPVLSRPQTLNQGKSLDDLIRVASYAKSSGPVFNVIVACSDGDPFSVAVSWLDALHAEGLIDICCVCWQIDKYYPPQDVVQMLIDASAWANPKGIPVTVHWGGGYPGWAESCACWNDITAETWGIHDRYTFQRFFLSVCDRPGHYGQCNTESDIDQVQSWLRKALVAMPEPMFLVAAEMDAQAEYDEPYQRIELYGDMKGLLALSADPNGRISGLNGLRGRLGQVVGT